MRTPGAANWTPEREDELRAHWASGESAAKIAALMGEGLTRNAVIGKAHRMHLGHRKSPILPRLPREEARARRNELQRQRRKERGPEPKIRAPRSNVPRPPKTIIRRPAVVYRADTGATDADLVSGWLERNGGARRFDTGDSGDALAMREFLQKRGYETAYSKGKILLKGRGRPRILSHKELVALVDDVRGAEGLPRIAA